MRRYMFALLIAAALVGLGAQPASATRRKPADVTVTIQPPAPAELGATLISVPVTISNLGEGLAEQIDLRATLDPSAGQLVDVQFDGPRAWVTAIDSGTLQARIEDLDTNTTLTMRVRYVPASPQASLIRQRISFRWEDGERGGSGVSNPPPGQVVDSAPAGTVNVLPISGTSRILFTSGSFASNEEVSAWYNAPDGSTVALLVIDNRELMTQIDSETKQRGRVSIRPTATAGSTGTLALTLDTAGLASGAYTLVLHGASSNLTLVGPFQVK